MKIVYTTGQVAKICKVSKHRVRGWFDSGRLRGYRVPGSQDRRIPREHLIRFMRSEGIVFDSLIEMEGRKVLFFGELGEEDHEDFVQMLGDIALVAVSTEVEFNDLLNPETEPVYPACVIVYYQEKDSVSAVVQKVRNHPQASKILLIGVYGSLRPVDESLFDTAFIDPFGWRAIVERVWDYLFTCT